MSAAEALRWAIDRAQQGTPLTVNEHKHLDALCELLWAEEHDQ